MGSQLVETPAEMMAKATRMLRRVMFLQMVWFACFVAGGLLLVWTAWKNHHLPAVCSGRAGPAVAKAGTVAAATLGCELHSYLLAVVLILGGIAALLVTGYVATRLAVRYLGSGAMAFLRGGRRSVGPTGPRGGQGMDGGFPGSTRSPRPGFKSGLPPGRSGPP
jgi:hypothetical protein